jgi:hypothetical protein
MSELIILLCDDGFYFFLEIVVGDICGIAVIVNEVDVWEIYDLLGGKVT